MHHLCTQSTKFASYNAEYTPKVGDKLHYGPPGRNSGDSSSLSPVIYAAAYCQVKMLVIRDDFNTQRTIPGHAVLPSLHSVVTAPFISLKARRHQPVSKVQFPPETPRSVPVSFRLVRPRACCQNANRPTLYNTAVDK